MVWQAVRGHLGEGLSPAEQELLALFRFAELRGEIVLDDKAEVLLAAVFEMLLERARQCAEWGRGHELPSPGGWASPERHGAVGAADAGIDGDLLPENCREDPAHPAARHKNAPQTLN